MSVLGDQIQVLASCISFQMECIQCLSSHSSWQSNCVFDHSTGRQLQHKDQPKHVKKIWPCLPMSLITARILDTKGPTSLECILALSLRSAPTRHCIYKWDGDIGIIVKQKNRHLLRTKATWRPTEFICCTSFPVTTSEKKEGLSSVPVRWSTAASCRFLLLAPFVLRGRPC